MFIRDIFAQKKPVLSFEVFPPKKDSGLDNVISAVDELSKMPIDYMSVTYGAGGSNSKNTAYIASHLKNNLSIPSLAHLTCVANSKDDIKVKLQEYKLQEFLMHCPLTPPVSRKVKSGLPCSLFQSVIFAVIIESAIIAYITYPSVIFPFLNKFHIYMISFFSKHIHFHYLHFLHRLKT